VAPVLVAPDKFKGTLSAAEVASAVAAGLRDGGREAVELPVADGGDGTAEALVAALGGEFRGARVPGPLGEEVEARFALLGDGRAVVEAAAASGLALVAEPSPRTAWAATTRGTGELIVAACEAGVAEVVVACGGTASTDGGAGALEALAEAGLRPKLTLACDVRTPWERAAAVFGPQKGADRRVLGRLEKRLAALAAQVPRNPRGQPLTGCGGGLSGGLWAHLGATLVPGAALVLDAIGFDGAMRAARFVVTGEGRIDPQTLEGKAVGEVATRCRQAGVGCHAVAGQNALDSFGARVLDLQTITEAGTKRRLRAAGRRLAGL